MRSSFRSRVTPGDRTDLPASANCGDNCPVQNVSWNDAQESIRRLNAQTGQRYRLPSDAEWE